MQKNAIVIMFDSLQRTYLGCYGNTWIKTPNMDRLAREGALFENSYTEGLPTVPCRRAMLTGRYTLPFSAWEPLKMEDTTIADLCWGRPIDTYMVFDCPPMRQSKFGFTRGFDKVWFTHGHELDHYYFENDPLIHLDPKNYINDSVVEGARKTLGQKFVDVQFHEISSYLKQRQYEHSAENRYVAKTIKKAVELLGQVDRNKQFFMWIDSFDPHEPWDPPSVYSNEPCPYDPTWTGKDDFLPFMGDCEGVYTEPELHHIRMLYAELVTLCDRWLGYLLDNIRAFGFEENTLFMMVSDHGEPLGNGEHGHGIMRKCRPWPYEELVHTPMLLRAPGVKPGLRIKGFVQSCDVAPTVCDWLGIGVHPDMQGKSLLPLVFGEVTSIRDYALAGYHGSGVSIYVDGWSYIHWLGRDKQDMDGFGLATAIGMAQASEHFKGIGAKSPAEALTGLASGLADDDSPDASAQSLDALERLRAAASADGAKQWTCTPGAKVIVPDLDELYDLKNDPFQLNNVIAKYPEKAVELLQKLNVTMSDLKAC